ncbi:TPA: tyrosine-type recombinase/integrase [Vibrio vulnificus]|nr:tyrosine-type recombinase/integrase [Vibrio vulnificus]
MRKVKVPDCQYAVSPITHQPQFCDVYVLLDDDGQMLFHENLWLTAIAKVSPPNTARGYANDLLSFVRMAKPLGGWAAIGQPEMTGYLHGELFQHRGYKKATMQRHIATLKQFYAWQVEKGYLSTVPDFEWNYEHLYTKDPMDKSSHHAYQHSFHSLYIDKSVFHNKLLPAVDSADEFIRLRDRLCLYLGYECGTRAHEVHDLNTVEVRKAITKAREENDGLWAVATIRITGKGASNRDLLIPPKLCEFIWDYLTKHRKSINLGRGPLICTRQGLPIQDPKHASTVFANACRKAKLKRVHKQGYHRLRKSFGTNLVQELNDEGRGGEVWILVPRRLGHKDVDTTKLYIQFDALRNNRSRVLKELHMNEAKYKAIRRQKTKQDKEAA